MLIYITFLHQKYNDEIVLSYRVLQEQMQLHQFQFQMLLFLQHQQFLLLLVVIQLHYMMLTKAFFVILFLQCLLHKDKQEYLHHELHFHLLFQHILYHQ